jgi:hypothetical protein
MFAILLMCGEVQFAGVWLRIFASVVIMNVGSYPFFPCLDLVSYTELRRVPSSSVS